MFVNTELLKEEAKHFEKYGYYTSAPMGTPDHMEYWSEQLRRCTEGYSVGGLKITGDHYFHLNFSRMKVTQESNKKEWITKKKVRTGQKKYTFPDFWDGDYDYFWVIEIARNGISEKDYKALNLETKIPDLDGGKHVMLAKARQRGYSYKGSSLVSNKYHTVRENSTIVGAFESRYLYPEGIMAMSKISLDFIDEYTAWTKRRLVDRQDYIKSGYETFINGVKVQKGYKSSINAITFKDNPDAGRGKTANLILLDECGKFNNLKQTYAALRPTVEAGSIVTGQIILFGTGGSMEAGGTIDFESMFYNPETYNLIAFDNIWDEESLGTTCGWFFPDYKNKEGFIDKDGNSDITNAKLFEEQERERIKKTSKDPQAIDRHITERPFCPREAFMQVSNNIFPVAELQKWRGKLLSSGLSKDIAVHGNLIKTGNGIKFKPSDSVRPIVNFPSKKSDDLTGCVTIYQSPFKGEDSKVPRGLYIVCHDPYAHDKTTGVSLGAAYVIKRMNNFSQPDDMIVASYVGRPNSMDEYNDNLFKLAEYYNAKIGFENDRGDVVGYAKRFRKLNWLNEEFEIIDNTNNIRFGKLGRKYGISMGTKDRKGTAAIYLRDWLNTKRGKDDNGEYRYNFHFIYDIALIDELIKYNMDGNFDRASALLCGMYYLKETYRKERELVLEESNENSFFDRDLF